MIDIQLTENHEEELKVILIDTLKDAKILSAELKREIEETCPGSSQVVGLPGISEIKICFIPGASKREEGLSEEVIKSDQRIIEKALSFKTKNSK